jgi:hypothetical protein
MYVQSYIDEGEKTHRWALGWLENYRAISTFNRNMAEICLLAMHPSFWQAYVTLMGYSQNNNISNPNKVLLEIPFEKIFSGEIDYPWKDVPYLNFATRFKTVSPNIFLGAVYVIRLSLAESSLKNDPATFECIMGCINKHYKERDTDWDVVKRCVEEEKC